MYIGVVLLWIVIFLLLFRKKKKIKCISKKKKSKGDNKEMYDQAKKYINKDCCIKMIDGRCDGIIIEVTDGAIVIEQENNKIKKVLNMEYVVSIMEYPKNKNGKRKNFF